MELNFTEEEANSGPNGPTGIATSHVKPTYDSGLLDAVSMSTGQDLPTLDTHSVPGGTGSSSQGGKVVNERPARIAEGNLRPSDILALDSSLGHSQRPSSGKSQVKPPVCMGKVTYG